MKFAFSFSLSDKVAKCIIKMQIQLQYTTLSNIQFQQVFTHTHKANITPKLDGGVTLNKILDVLENRTLISNV